MSTNDVSATAPTPPTTPACTVIGSYPISDDEICDYLAYCKPREVVGGRTMLARGEADQASMKESDFQKWWNTRHMVPSALSDKYVVFPKASDAIGRVRYACRLYGDWRHHYRLSLDDDWGDGGVLVRFRSVAGTCPHTYA